MDKLKKNSRIIKFYKKTQNERLKILKDFSNLSTQDIVLLQNKTSISFDEANRMIENVIGTIPIPLGIATNFLINKKDYLIPMAIEEPSIIAAASKGAKIARKAGGFLASHSKPMMIGQILLTKIKNTQAATKNIEAYKQEIINLANKQDSILANLKGGALDLTTKSIKTSRGVMLVVHLLVNVKDAMGANIVNTMAEKIAPLLEQFSKGKALLKIVSNLPIYKIIKAKATFKKEIIGKTTIEKILDAYEFAKYDIFRCATHNKGIMNGIDAVAIATGNDFRAIEAGAHAFAAFNKRYSPLTKYYKDKNNNLVGQIELPITVGTVGGITQTHPTAKLCIKMVGVKSSSELSQVMACVGLAQNFSAIHALVTKGIQYGHMRLHSKNIAISAGAKNELIDLVAQKMIEEHNISLFRAIELVEHYAKQN